MPSKSPTLTFEKLADVGISIFKAIKTPNELLKQNVHASLVAEYLLDFHNTITQEDLVRGDRVQRRTYLANVTEIKATTQRATGGSVHGHLWKRYAGAAQEKIQD